MVILVMALCAVICGADDWVEVALFAESKRQWLETFLESPSGLPSQLTARPRAAPMIVFWARQRSRW
jgi:hypothetical protein